MKQAIRRLDIKELFVELNDHCFDQDPLNGHPTYKTNFANLF